MNKNCFDFLYIIGRGGFGKVWKVRLKQTNELFALKEMSKMKIIDRRSEISIMSEKTLLSKINNPFIVNMYFTFQDFSNLYLVMDLLTGGDLRYHLAKKKRFSEKETKFFIANMLLALEYIHSKNIIHRDIKPENLVLELNGYLRITDFGVAKINEKDNSSETSGTPGYMAPEVILVQNHSFPSDFFALGVIGYEFMLGFRPYLGRSRKEIKELIIYKQARLDECDIPYSWSLESGDFINKLLKRKPIKRLGYHGVKEIKNHLWMRDINWDLLKKKELTAPFIPNPNRENYDKAYCERIEDIGETTIERYQEYAESELFLEVFEGYTYINIDYLKSKKNPNSAKKEKADKSKEANKRTIRNESSSSRIKKNYSINLTNQKKTISISQEKNRNNTNSHNRIKNNKGKRNQNSTNIKQVYPTPKKQTIDIENKKEVLKRMSANDNIKTNKKYLSNINNIINDNNKKDLELKYDKEKLKKRALKISARMRELNNKNEININLNLNNKKPISKKFVMNKSNSMKILNSLNKENLNNNIVKDKDKDNMKKNNSKRKDMKSSKTIRNNNIKSNIEMNNNINIENKNSIFVEKKKSYQRYNVHFNIKDKQIKKEEAIHKSTYDINKKQIKLNNEQIKVKIKEQKLLKEKIQNDNSKRNIFSNREYENKINDKSKKKIKNKVNDNNKNKELEEKINENNNEKEKENKNEKDIIDNSGVQEIKNKDIQNDNKIQNNNNEKYIENEEKEIEKKLTENEENENKEVEKNYIKINLDSKINKNENSLFKENKPQSKIMLWIQRSLPYNQNGNHNNKKYCTIDNNLSNTNRENTNLINANKSLNNHDTNNINKELSLNYSHNNIINRIIDNNVHNKDQKQENNDSNTLNRKNYKTIIIDTSNKFNSKNIKKKYYKSTNNSKNRVFSKNNSCPNIYFDKHNVITKEIKPKTPKNTFLVFNTININLGNTGKNYKRNKTPKIHVMKNINSSIKNFYLSNDFLIEPMKFTSYFKKKILEKNKSSNKSKKKINPTNKKFKEFKRNNLNKNNNTNSDYIKSI